MFKQELRMDNFIFFGQARIEKLQTSNNKDTRSLVQFGQFSSILFENLDNKKRDL